MVLASFLYFVSIFGGDFGNFLSFFMEIALRGKKTGKSPVSFPKIMKMLSKNGKSPTSTGARPPSLTRSGVRRAPVELGHGSAAGFFSEMCFFRGFGKLSGIVNPFFRNLFPCAGAFQ